MHVLIAFVISLAIVCVTSVIAAEKKEQKSCEIQLSEQAVRVHHLVADREEKEKKIAELQTALYVMHQQKQAVEKQLETLKPKEEKPQ